jgi:hypothetical protein
VYVNVEKSFYLPTQTNGNANTAENEDDKMQTTSTCYVPYAACTLSRQFHTVRWKKLPTRGDRNEKRKEVFVPIPVSDSASHPISKQALPKRKKNTTPNSVIVIHTIPLLPNVTPLEPKGYSCWK